MIVFDGSVPPDMEVVMGPGKRATEAASRSEGRALAAADRDAAVREDRIAAAFHEAYERLAPQYGYKTRDASAVPWEDVPSANKRLMRRVARDLLDKGVIRAA